MRGGRNIPTPEELEVALCFVLVVISNSLLDLRKLGLDPRVIDIAMSMELGKRLQALLPVAMIDEPTRTLGEEQNQRDEDNSGNELDSERDLRT